MLVLMPAFFRTRQAEWLQSCQCHACSHSLSCSLDHDGAPRHSSEEVTLLSVGTNSGLEQYAGQGTGFKRLSMNHFVFEQQELTSLTENWHEL
jgi:hypothetical protein